MSFETDRNKIRKIYNKVKETENILGKVTTVDVTPKDTNFLSSEFKYETEWTRIANYPHYDSLKLKLTDFDISIIPFVSVIVVFKTEDGFADRVLDINNDPDGYWLYTDFNYFWELQEVDANRSVSVCHIDTSGFLGDYRGYLDEDNVELPLYYKIILTASNPLERDELRNSKK